MSTIPLEFCSRAAGISVHVALETLSMIRRNTQCGLPGAFRVLWVNIDAFEVVSDLELHLRGALGGSERRTSLSELSVMLDREVGCVVFDGVETIGPTDLDQFEEFVAELMSRCRTTKFVLTSQVALQCAAFDKDIELGRIDDTASRTILTAGNLSLREDPQETSNGIAALLTFAEGHPLTLRLLNGLLRYFKSTRTVLARLASSGAGALVRPSRKQQTRVTSLNICLAIAYDSLTPDERRILFLAAHAPAGLAILMLSSNLEIGGADPDLAIAALERWHLLYATDDSLVGIRLSLLSPIRAFVQKAYEQADQARADAEFEKLARRLMVQSVVVNAKYMNPDDITYGMRRLAEEFPNLNHVLDQATRRSERSPGCLKIVASLALSLQSFCFTVGYWHRGIEIMRAGAAAARQLREFVLASDILLQLISQAQRLAADTLMRETAEEIQRLSEEFSDMQIAGNAALAHGLIARLDNRIADAERHFQQAFDCFQQCPATESESQPELTVPESAEGQAHAGSRLRMVAYSLMELGQVREYSGHPERALPLYERALALTHAEHDGVNIAPLMHQMGNYLSSLGRFPEAFQAYLDAANAFLQISAARQLSNPLSELGYLLLEYEHPSLSDETISRELLEMGMNDVLTEALGFFRSGATPFPVAQWPNLVRKLFGVVALASLTSGIVILDQFAKVLQEQIVAPLLAELDRSARSTDDRLAIAHLNLLAALCSSAASLSNFEDGKVTPPLKFVEHLTQLCYQQGDWGQRTLRLFDWLAQFLVRRTTLTSASANALQAAAANAARGEKFVVPGLRI